MQMKVFNKGQVVIPSTLRREMGISPGDFLDFCVNRTTQSIEIKKTDRKNKGPASALNKYAQNKPFPSKSEIKKAIIKGLTAIHES